MGRDFPDMPAEKLPETGWREPVSPAAFLRRILDSETFRRSDRLKELLAYLVERGAAFPDSPAREQDIGATVYGRSPAYDTSHDTIVRVQVTQLRKKLERYYETEGMQDRLILTIPRGRYQAHWQPREVETSVVERPPVLEVSAPPVPVHRRSLAVGSVTALCVLLCGAALWWMIHAGSNPVAASGLGPSVTRLWSQLLIKGRPTHVVLSDPGIVMVTAATGQPVRFPELGDHRFLRRLESLPGGPFRSFLESTTAAQLTTLSDVEIVRRVTALELIDPAMLNVVIARDFRIRDLNNQNTILIGYRRSNPWVDVFQQSLNFTVDMDAATQTVQILNAHPREGESARYLVGNPQTTNPVQGFAAVAFLPNPAATGKTLIISAPDVPGTESAIRFLMGESLWEPFYRKIAVKGTVPWFEVVLAYRRLSNSSGDVEPVAWRVRGP